MPLPIRQGQTITPEKGSPVKKARTEVSESSVSARAGTSLTMIDQVASPYMGTGVGLPTPAPPSILVSSGPSLT